MVVDFSKIDPKEKPIIILKDSADNSIGVVTNATNVNLSIKYNEVSTIEFDVAEYVDGEKSEIYDSLVGLRTIDVKDVGQFILVNPKVTQDGLKTIKSCKGYSLEYEFTHRKITLPNGTYNFHSPVSDDTIIGIILQEMPSWSVGSIDSELVGKYRTFEISNENIYNFIKNTLQVSYNCIFDFDTYNRTINVRSVKSSVEIEPVYISHRNLAKEITVEEDTENIVTRLDVNGAEGVDIRDVNPDGTNKILNLDHYMNTAHFSQSIIDKYNHWKEVYEGQRLPYYNLSVERSLKTMQLVSERAKLAKLNGELAVLEVQLSTILQGQAAGVSGLSTGTVNSNISAKRSEIVIVEGRISTFEDEISDYTAQMSDINERCKLSNSYDPDYSFEETELRALDRYITDDAISESSFVSITTDFDGSTEDSNFISNASIEVNDSHITKVSRALGSSSTKYIYDFRGGRISIQDIDADIISAALETFNDKTDFIFTAYLGSGTNGSTSFGNACVTFTGNTADANSNDYVIGSFVQEDSNISSLFVSNSIDFSTDSGFLYFTMDTNSYQRHSVAWELYEYGNDVLKKLSQPSYSFSVDSANFFNLEEYKSFQDNIKLGNKIYLEVSEGHILSPILIGADISYSDYGSLSLEFGDRYVSSDSAFQLVDLLEQSVSMGKTVDASKYTYSAFTDSGASSSVRSYIQNALDVSKNAIMSSGNQATTWDSAGIRLRKWANEEHTAYDDKQIWMNNNCIMMTDNNWTSAKMAIGEIQSGNSTVWGVVADSIVGKMIAGANLTIESEVESGGTSVFKVDGSGCKLYNCDLEIFRDGNGRIKLNPTDGITIYQGNGTDDESKVFYADTDGNVVFKGRLMGASGKFHGELEAATGSFSGDISGSNGTFEGDISAATGTFKGNLYGSTITAGTINSGNINSANINSANITSGTITASDIICENGTNRVVINPNDGLVIYQNTGGASSPRYSNAVFSEDSNGGLSIEGSFLARFKNHHGNAASLKISNEGYESEPYAVASIRVFDSNNNMFSRIESWKYNNKGTISIKSNIVELSNMWGDKSINIDDDGIVITGDVTVVGNVYANNIQ